MPIDASDNFYSDGAITLTHGSDVVTGAFTSWTSALLPLDLIFPGASASGVTAIKDVVSNTELRLGRPWDGPTLTDVPYFCLRWTAHTDPRNYGPRLATYLARLDQVPPDLDAFLASIEAAIAAMAAHAEAAQDSADAAHADRVAAETARTGAETARDAAQTYRDGAEDYRDWAQLWAGKMDGPVSGSDYSAQYWAEQAGTTLASFDARYLGAKASGPTTDNHGGALVVGALYFDTVIGGLRAWTGSAWVDPSTLGLADNSVSNGKLADMATARLKGRATAGEGDPEDLSGTQVTALLNVFYGSGASHAKGLVPDPGASAGATKYLREDATWAEPATLVGDSGSGGTKGLVPAPAAGDAAGGKYLKADGGWGAPPTGVDATNRRNILLNSMRIAKALGSAQRYVNVLADGYAASDGIAAGPSSNYAVDTTNKRVGPTTNATVVQTSLTAGSNSLAGHVDLDRSLTAIPNSVSVASLGIYSTVATSITIGIFQRVSAGSYTVVAQTTFPHAGGGWQDAALASPYSVPASGTYYVGARPVASIAISTTTTNAAYAAGASFPANGGTITLTETASGNPFLFRYTHSVAVNNMTLVSTTVTADAVPTTVQALLDIEPIDTIVLGTDLRLEVTRDGGTTWTAATLTQVATIGTRRVVESAAQSVTGQPSGSSVAYRLKSLNNKSLRVYGAALTWS